MTRPLNLVIIALTMMCAYLIDNTLDSMLVDIHFVFRIVSAVCIAAAGNVINDYFDRKVDLINKPERTYVDVSVKRRVAIASHFFLNALGITAGLMGCVQVHWIWMLCPFATILILWWYSPVLKKKFLIGNLAVGICTALVPLWAVCFEIDLPVIIAVSFAFLTTVLREIVKDVEDTRGDLAAGYDTLAIRFGIVKTKRVLTFISAIIFCFCILLIANAQSLQQQIFYGIILGSTLVVYAQMKRAKEPEDFRVPSRSLKIMMLLGVMLLPCVY